MFEPTPPAEAVDGWPSIPYSDWSETCAALHLWCQIAGKYKLAHTPWLNHSWHATLAVTASGLTTGLVPDAGGIEILFDLREHWIAAVSARGGEAGFRLEAMSVFEFHRRFIAMIAELGGRPAFSGVPNEIPGALPFCQDMAPRAYDGEAVSRFHRALSPIAGILQQFRTGFLGKSSPVHLFWGSFDLAVTRFSGRRAPLHPGGIPGLPDAITREAYSHEVSSAGFWPGGGGPIDEPCFYSYAYPQPPGFADAAVRPATAGFSGELGEFLLPYEKVRRAEDPAAALLEFLNSTYTAAADLGHWDRSELECEMGAPRKPRRV